MRLAKFGVISLDGAVNGPKPSADFQGYQNTLTSYQSARELAKCVHYSSPQLDRRLRKLADSIRATLASS